MRMALGASPSSVLRLILRQGMMLVCLGAGIGLVLALLIGRAFSRMLFGLNPADPLSLTGAAAALILVAMLACYLPALAAQPHGSHTSFTGRLSQADTTQEISSENSKAATATDLRRYLPLGKGQR